MYRVFQSFLVAGLLGIASPLPALAGHKDCRPTAFEHLRAAPDGMAIRKQVKQEGFFEGWIRCDDAQFALPTAVHETTHIVSAETDAFPLIGGGALARPHEVTSFFPPYKIAKTFKTDGLVSIYLRRGKASSSTDFLYLLDELNAYSHDLNAAVDLKDLKRENESIDHRDGTSAMMAFLAVYAETAKTKEPKTWSGLQQPQVKKTIAGLWGQAERTLSSSCGIPHFGHSDQYYMHHFCDSGAQSAIGQIIGRAPVCSAVCLKAAPEDQVASDDGIAETPFVDFRPTSRRRSTRQKRARSAMSSAAD